MARVSLMLANKATVSLNCPENNYSVCLRSILYKQYSAVVCGARALLERSGQPHSQERPSVLPSCLFTFNSKLQWKNCDIGVPCYSEAGLQCRISGWTGNVAWGETTEKAELSHSMYPLSIPWVPPINYRLSYKWLFVSMCKVEIRLVDIWIDHNLF